MVYNLLKGLIIYLYRGYNFPKYHGHPSIDTRVANLSPEKHFRKQAATDGTKPDINIGETRVWRLDSGPNLQPCNSIPLENKLLLIFINFTLKTSLKKWYTMFSRPLHTPMPSYAYVLSLKSGLEFWQSGALYHQSDDQLLHGTGVRTSTWVTTSKYTPKV